MSWDDYLQLAARQSAEDFAMAMPSRFLLKRPSSSLPTGPVPSDIPFKTTFTKSHVDPFACEWMALPVQKRKGNPYPDRISIGRATNCDIVLRVPFVSKVHAHLLIRPDGSHAIKDNNAANATRLNRHPLSPNEPHPLELGDLISFVSMDFVFVDGVTLHDALCKELAK